MTARTESDAILQHNPVDQVHEERRDQVEPQGPGVDAARKENHQKTMVRRKKQRVKIATKILEGQQSHGNHAKDKNDLDHEHRKIVIVRILQKKNLKKSKKQRCGFVLSRYLMQCDQVSYSIENDPVPQPT